jgi:hypothetical protein
MKPLPTLDSCHRRSEFEPPPRRRKRPQLTVEFRFQASPFGPSGRFPDPDRCSSIYLISRKFFRREFLLEAAMFVGLVLIAAWPIGYMIGVVLKLAR